VQLVRKLAQQKTEEAKAWLQGVTVRVLVSGCQHAALNLILGRSDFIREISSSACSTSFSVVKYSYSREQMDSQSTTMYNRQMQVIAMIASADQMVVPSRATCPCQSQK